MSTVNPESLELPLLTEAWEQRQRRKKWKTRTVVFISVLVTAIWFIVIQSMGLWDRVVPQWRAALTMVFGSFVAGATPQGGGAVAFPVFTKVLQVPAEMARTFSLAIQTIGMGTASLAIVIRGLSVEWRSVLLTTLSGLVGFALVAAFALNPEAPFAPALLPGAYVKVTFTIVLLAMAFVVYVGSLVNVREVHRALPELNGRMFTTLLLLGFIGGATSALVGSGMDVFVYLGLVVFFMIDPRVGVPTSVICMTLISIFGFLIFGIADAHLWVDLNETGEVYRIGAKTVSLNEKGRLVFAAGTPLLQTRFDLLGMWLASIPVVTWGAPLGSWFASMLSSRRLVLFVTLLALTELCTTLIFLEPLRKDPVLMVYALLGSIGAIATVRWISKHRKQIFQLPDVNIHASFHADRLDVSERYSHTPEQSP